MAPVLKNILSTVKEQVVQGVRLSDALAQHPKVFGNIYISMVSAGEAAGAMDIVLQRLAELTEKQAALKSKIIGALMYPLIMDLATRYPACTFSSSAKQSLLGAREIRLLTPTRSPPSRKE